MPKPRMTLFLTRGRAAPRAVARTADAAPAANGAVPAAAEHKRELTAQERDFVRALNAVRAHVLDAARSGRWLGSHAASACVVACAARWGVPTLSAVYSVRRAV